MIAIVRWHDETSNYYHENYNLPLFHSLESATRNRNLSHKLHLEFFRGLLTEHPYEDIVIVCTTIN